MGPFLSSLSPYAKMTGLNRERFVPNGCGAREFVAACRALTDATRSRLQARSQIWRREDSRPSLACRPRCEEMRVALGAARLRGDQPRASIFRSVFDIGTLRHINEIALLVLSTAVGFQLPPWGQSGQLGWNRLEIKPTTYSLRPFSPRRRRILKPA